MRHTKLGAVLLAALLAGCVAVPHNRHPRGKAHGHRKHHNKHHVHGPNCGHTLHNGHWQVSHRGN